MHEYGIAASLRRMVEAEARAVGARRVVRVEVRVGDAAGVERDLLATAWAQALAEQTTDPELAGRFAPIAAALTGKYAQIEQELLDDQGHANDIGGYYRPDVARAEAAMKSFFFTGLLYF